MALEEDIKLGLDTSGLQKDVKKAEKILEPLSEVDIKINLETDLAEANLKKFRNKAGDLKDIKVKIDADIKDAESNLNKLIKGFDGKDIKIGADITKAEAALKKLQRQAESNKIASIKVELDTNKAESKLKEIQRKAEGLKNVDFDVDADTKDAQKGVEQLEDKVNSLKGSIDSVGLSFGNLAGGLAVGGAIVGIGSLIGSASELEQSLNKVQAATGKTDKEIAKLKESSKELFVAGVGDGLDSVIISLGLAEQKLGDIAEAQNIDLTSFVKSAAAIGNAFEDLDTDQVIEKSRTALKAFALEGENAGNFISAIALAGKNFDDSFDSINEYSPLLSALGVDAEATVELLKRASDEQIRNSDILFDSLKEAGIRINAGDFETAFKDLSASANEAGVEIEDSIVGAFENISKATGSEKEIVDKIEGIIKAAQEGDIDILTAIGLSSDAIKKGVDTGALSKAMAQSLQVAIAGTPAEEIGVEAFNKIFSAPIPVGLLDQKGKEASEQLAKALELGGLEGAKRQIEVLFGGLADQLLPALQPVIKILTEQLLPVIGQLLTSIAPLIGVIAEELGGAFAQLLPEILPLVDVLISDLVPIISTLVGSILPLFVNALRLIIPVISFLLDKVGDLVEFIVRLGGAVVDVVSSGLDKLASFFGLSDDSAEKTIEGTTEAVVELTDAEKKANKEKEKTEALEKGELKRKEDLLKVANSQISTSDKTTQAKKAETEATKALRKEEEARIKNLKTSKGTLEEFFKSQDQGTLSNNLLLRSYVDLAVAEAERTEEQKTLKDSLDALVKAQLEANEQQNKSGAELFEQENERLIKKRESEQFTTLFLSEEQIKRIENQEEADEIQNQITQDFVEAQSFAYQAMGGAIGESFGLALTGQEEAGRAIISTAFDILESLVPILSTQIILFSLASAESVATLGAAGLAKAAILTALLQGLVSGVRSGLGFNDGGTVGVDGGKPSASDTVPIMATKGEKITKLSMSNKYGALLDSINNDNVDSWLNTQLAGTNVSRPLETVSMPNVSFNTNSNESAVVNEIRGLRHDNRELKASVDMLQNKVLQTTQFHLNVNDNTKNKVRITAGL